MSGIMPYLATQNPGGMAIRCRHAVRSASVGDSRAARWACSSPAGAPMARARRSFYAVLRAAGLLKGNLYRLRRTMASIMHALGVPPKVTASRMGHADTQVLFKHYIREFDAQDVYAAESMAAAIREARRIEHRQAEGDT